MKIVNMYWTGDSQSNWRVLTEVFSVLDEMQEALSEQKTTLRFVNNIDLCLNLNLFKVTQRMTELMNKVLFCFAKGLNWLVVETDDPARISIEQILKAEFSVNEVTS